MADLRKESRTVLLKPSVMRNLLKHFLNLFLKCPILHEPVLLQKHNKSITHYQIAMNVFKCLPRCGAYLMDWHQSVSHNLSGTGLGNTSENSAGKKST